MQYGKFGTDQAERDFRAAYLTDSTAWYIKPSKPPLTIIQENTMKKLFWVAVLYHRGKNGKNTEVVLDPEPVLAVNGEEVKKAAIKMIPAHFKERFDRLEVVVRPF